MKHKHYEIIVTKASNTELVVFVKGDQGWSLKENQSDIQFHEEIEYFLCLPKHCDFCLLWLNGGACSGTKPSGYKYNSNDGRWGFGFRKNHPFMDPDATFNQIPKIEKRWILAGSNSLLTMMYFDSRESAEEYNTSGAAAKPIEIEVEV